MKYQSRLFFKADPSGSSGGAAAGSPAPTVSSHARMAQSGLPDGHGPHPMDARPGSMLDDDSNDDLAASVSRAGSKPAGEKAQGSGQDPTPASFFEDGYDPNTLEAPLREKYAQMKSALDRRLAGAPDVETIGQLGMKAQAFDRLIGMREFQEWAAKFTGEDAPSSDGKQAAQGAEDLLAGLDEDVKVGVQSYIQQTVDRALADKITPLADSYYGGEAERQIGKLREVYGTEFEALVPRAQALMQTVDGLMAEEAFKLAHYDSLKAANERQKQASIRAKEGANMLTTDGPSNTAPMQRTVRTPKDALLLALEQVGRGEGWDPRTDLTQRSE